MSTSVVHVCCGMLPFGQSIFTSFNSPPNQSIRKLFHPLEGFLVPLWDMAGPPLWLFSDSCVSFMALALEVFKLKWLWLPWWPSLETFEGWTFLLQCPSCHCLLWRKHRWEWRLLSGTDLPVGASPRTFAGLSFLHWKLKGQVWYCVVLARRDTQTHEQRCSKRSSRTYVTNFGEYSPHGQLMFC